MSMIQLTKYGCVVDYDLQNLRMEFERRHCVRLGALLGPEVLQIVRKRLERGRWYPRVDDLGCEATLDDAATIQILCFVTNTPRFLEIVREITTCPDIDTFRGRVYRIAPGAGHHNIWHDDVAEQRLVGMSINLSTEVFRGGAFQLRKFRSSKILDEIRNTGFGDAIMFRISNTLEHRISEVEGTVEKTAFAGWFRANQPNFYAAIRDPRFTKSPSVESTGDSSPYHPRVGR